MAAKAQNLSFAPRSRAAVARRAHNPKVTGSIPVFATKSKARLSLFWFIFDKLGWEGSYPPEGGHWFDPCLHNKKIRFN